MGLFVSYSSRDTAAIDTLMTALRRAHEQVWFDEELGGGEAWWRQILEQIRNCEVFIFALSKNSLDSKPCQAELRYAQDLQRPILPVQIGSLDSMRVNPLAAVQVVDFRNPTVDQGIQLITSINAQRAQLSGRLGTSGAVPGGSRRCPAPRWVPGWSVIAAGPVCVGVAAHSAGSLSCGTYNGAPEVAWTNNANLTLGVVDGPAGSDIATLYRWWKAEG